MLKPFPSNNTGRHKRILVSVKAQRLECHEGDVLYKEYSVSTAKNGLGEQEGSECTPRGWHRIHEIIGGGAPVNSIFIGRKWTDEIYTPDLAASDLSRDWILTRILWLDGLEPGRNKGGDLDSLKRYIYLHGTPDSNRMGVPSSHGCIRMRNLDIIELAQWVSVDTLVCIE